MWKLYCLRVQQVCHKGGPRPLSSLPLVLPSCVSGSVSLACCCWDVASCPVSCDRCNFSQNVWRWHRNSLFRTPAADAPNVFISCGETNGAGFLGYSALSKLSLYPHRSASSSDVLSGLNDNDSRLLAWFDAAQSARLILLVSCSLTTKQLAMNC